MHKPLSCCKRHTTGRTAAKTFTAYLCKYAASLSNPSPMHSPCPCATESYRKRREGKNVLENRIRKCRGLRLRAGIPPPRRKADLETEPMPYGFGHRGIHAFFQPLEPRVPILPPFRFPFSVEKETTSLPVATHNERLLLLSPVHLFYEWTGLRGQLHPCRPKPAANRVAHRGQIRPCRAVKRDDAILQNFQHKPTGQCSGNSPSAIGRQNVDTNLPHRITIG